jgi:hypothetical protein
VTRAPCKRRSETRRNSCRRGRYRGIQEIPCSMHTIRARALFLHADMSVEPTKPYEGNGRYGSVRICLSARLISKNL